MDTDQYVNNEQSDADFQTLLADLISIKNKYIAPTLNFYNTHGKLPMVLFGIFGVITILLSVSLPVLTTLKETWEPMVVQIVAVLVAGSTSLMQFFRWESIWKGYSQSGQTLDYLLTIWELKITLAKHEGDTQKAIDMAVEATRQLIEASHAAIGSEAEAYFQQFHIPRKQQGQ